MNTNYINEKELMINGAAGTKTLNSVKEIKNRLIANGKLIAHPTKKHLIFKDGDINNTHIDNLYWSNTNAWMRGCWGMNLNSNDGGFTQRNNSSVKDYKDAEWVKAIASGVYPEHKKEIAQTTNVNVGKLLGRRFR